MLKGTLVTLVPAKLDDRQKIYEWCFHCETSKFHSGPPNYPNVPIPTCEEFYGEYADYFFTGLQPKDGRGFMIAHDNAPVGFISYCSFHLKPDKAELDIWLNSEKNCGKGFGTDAIITLSDWLGATLGIREFIMRPSKQNLRAIASYKKAAFEESDMPPDNYLLEEYIPLYGDGDYGTNETALMVKQI
jgi:Acetyltransferases, including N-acetylases of ribosomal proteins